MSADVPFVRQMVSGLACAPGNSDTDSRAIPGYWAIFLVRALVKHPASPLLLSLCTDEQGVAFNDRHRLGMRNGYYISGLLSHSSHLRVPTHRPPRLPVVAARAHYRPAELSFGRVGFAPTR